MGRTFCSGNLGGGSSSALCVNNFGEVVGISSTGTQQTHAFFWKQNQPIMDIDVALAEGAAFGINGHGTVVGRLKFANQEGQRASVWSTQTGLKDLNLEIPAQSGWFLYDARAVNDRGLIVGNGTFNGAERGFVLVPVPTIPLSTRTSALKIPHDYRRPIDIFIDGVIVGAPGFHVPTPDPGPEREIFAALGMHHLASLLSNESKAREIQRSALNVASKQVEQLLTIYPRDSCK